MKPLTCRSTLAVLLFAGLASTTAVHAATPVTVLRCENCKSLNELRQFALSKLINGWSFNPMYPLGTVGLVTSNSYPLSGYFRVALVTQPLPAGGWGQVPGVVAITPSNEAAAALDNLLLARAAKVPPIEMPPHLPHSETPELIADHISATLVPTGETGFSVWHFITNFPMGIYHRVVDTRSGQTHDLFVGDLIRVHYPDGSTEDWKFLGVLSGGSIQYQRVEGSWRDANGNPPAPGGGSSSPIGAGIALTFREMQVWPTAICSVRVLDTQVCVSEPGVGYDHCAGAYRYMTTPC